MTQPDDNDARHEGASFEPAPAGSADPGPTPAYPPEADPDKGDLPAAEVPGEQTDPSRRLTGGDQETGPAQDDLVTPGSVEPSD